MLHAAARMAARDRDAGRYQSHRPEQTLLLGRKIADYFIHSLIAELFFF